MFDYRDNLVRNVNRKFFDHAPLKREELKSYDVDGGRFYDVPLPYHRDDYDYIVYPSVTTVLAKKTDHSWLKEWENLIGKERATEITISAGYRGTIIHEMAAKYLYGQEYWRGQGTLNIINFNRVVPILNSHISCIYGIELPLYSHRLKTAGRTDLVCKWDNINSIVDFKTSSKDKLEEQIQDYFIQTTCYALMFEERYNIDIPRIVIVLLVDHENDVSVFVKEKKDFIEKVEEYFT